MGRRQIARHVLGQPGKLEFDGDRLTFAGQPDGDLVARHPAAEFFHCLVGRLHRVAAQGDDLIARLNSGPGGGTVGIDEADDQAGRFAGQWSQRQQAGERKFVGLDFFGQFDVAFQTLTRAGDDQPHVVAGIVAVQFLLELSLSRNRLAVDLDDRVAGTQAGF